MTHLAAFITNFVEQIGSQNFAISGFLVLNKGLFLDSSLSIIWCKFWISLLNGIPLNLYHLILCHKDVPSGVKLDLHFNIPAKCVVYFWICHNVSDFFLYWSSCAKYLVEVFLKLFWDYYYTSCFKYVTTPEFIWIFRNSGEIEKGVPVDDFCPRLL